MGINKNERISVNRERSEKFDQIRKRLENQQAKQLKPSQGPFPNDLLEKGTKIYAYTTGKEKMTKAVILKDFGSVCLIKKEEAGRFNIIKLHKSRISLRFD